MVQYLAPLQYGHLSALGHEFRCVLVVYHGMTQMPLHLLLSDANADIIWQFNMLWVEVPAYASQIRVVTDKDFKDPAMHKNVDHRLDWEKLSSDMLLDNRPGMDNRPVLKCPTGGKVLPSGIIRFYPRPASRAPRVSPQPPTPKALSSIVGGNTDEPEVAVPFPNTSFSASGEALLGGKRPTMRYALRAVRLLKLPDSEEEEVVEIENIRGEVSSAFCVATKRTEHDAKAEVPTLDDPVCSPLFHFSWHAMELCILFGPHACWKEDCCKGQLSCSPRASGFAERACPCQACEERLRKQTNPKSTLDYI
jgi:hypothetical protein